MDETPLGSIKVFVAFDCCFCCFVVLIILVHIFPFQTSEINNITDFQSKFTNSLKLSGFSIFTFPFPFLSLLFSFYFPFFFFFFFFFFRFGIECKDTTYILFSENDKSKQEWMSSLKKVSFCSCEKRKARKRRRKYIEQKTYNYNVIT